jgi:AraC-like DNA-binding protein
MIDRNITEKTRENDIVHVLSACHVKREPDNYHLLREKGQSAVNFIHFLSPVRIVTEQETIQTTKNACIVYTAGTRQEYFANGCEMINNFVTFLPPPSFLSSFPVPLNEVFYVKEDAPITHLVEYITWAIADKAGAQESTEDIEGGIDLQISIRMTELLKTLAQLQISDTPKDVRDFMKKQHFAALRSDIRMNPGDWTVDKMAKSVWLTRSRFSIVYKELFGISPNADLMNASIEYAEQLLTNTSKRTSEITKECGYKSKDYFCRLFRRSVGVTPEQYRISKNRGQ